MATQGQDAFIGFRTNLPEVTTQIQRNLAELSALLGKGIAPLTLGSIDTGGLALFGDQLKKIAASAEADLARIQQAFQQLPAAQRRNASAQVTVPGIGTGSRVELANIVREQANLMAAALGGGLLKAAPELTKLIDMRGIVETLQAQLYDSARALGINQRGGFRPDQFSQSAALDELQAAQNDILGRKYGYVYENGRLTQLMKETEDGPVAVVNPQKLQTAVQTGLKSQDLSRYIAEALVDGELVPLGSNAAYNPKTRQFFDKINGEPLEEADIRSTRLDQLRRMADKQEQAEAARLQREQEAADKKAEQARRAIAAQRLMEGVDAAGNPIGQKVNRSLYFEPGTGDYYRVSRSGGVPQAEKLQQGQAGYTEAVAETAKWMKDQSEATKKLIAEQQRLAREMEIESRLLAGQSPVAGMMRLASGQLAYTSGSRIGKLVKGSDAQRFEAEEARQALDEASRMRKAALDQAMIANQIYERHGVAAMPQGFTGPNGESFSPGNYRVSTGVPLDAMGEREYFRRTARTIPGAFMGGLTGLGIQGGGEGFDPQALVNLAATAGSVAKYTLLYNSLFLLTGVMSDTLQEAKNMSDSLRDLSIAMGSTEDASVGFVSALSSIARIAGANVGEALDAAARGVRMFGEGLDEAQIELVGQSVAAAATNLSLIVNKTLPDALGDVTAVGTAFGMTATELNSVVDAVSTAKNTLGGNPTQVSQGLANIAQAASEAGLSLQEAANAIALVQGRTDQSGQAVSTRLSRVFAILGGTTGRSIVARLNQDLRLVGQEGEIDADASVRDQFIAIANAYRKASPQLQGLIRSALGGSSNTKELIPILNNPELVFNGAEDPGAGAEEAARKSEDLVGTLRKLQGSLSAIQTDLVQSKIFAPFAVGLKIVEVAANGIDRFLKLYLKLIDAVDNLPILSGLKQFGGFSGLATLAVELTLFTVALRALGGVTAFRTAGAQLMAPVRAAIAGFAASIRAGGAGIGAASAQAGWSIRQGGAAGGAAAAAGGAASGRMAALGAGAAAGARGLGLTNPYVLAALAAVAGFMVFDAVQSRQGDLENALAQRRNAQVAPGYIDFGDASNSLLATVESLRNTGGIGAFLNPGREITDELEETAESWSRLAKKIDEERKEIAKQGRGYGALGDLFTTTVDDLNSRLDALKVAGLTTSSSLDVLLASIEALNLPRASRVSPTEAVTTAYQDFLDSRNGKSTALTYAALVGSGEDFPEGAGKRGRGIPFQGASANNYVDKAFEAVFNDGDMLALISDMLTPYLAAGKITDVDRGAIEQKMSEILSQNPQMAAVQRSFPKVYDAAVDYYTKWMLENLFGPQEANTLSAATATELAAKVTEGLDARLGRMRNPYGRVSVAKSAVESIEEIMRRTPGGEDMRALIEARNQAQEKVYEETNKMIEARARSRAGRNPARGNQILTQAYTRLVMRAADYGWGDLDRVTELISSGNKEQAKMLVRRARAQLRLAKAAQRTLLDELKDSGLPASVIAGLIAGENAKVDKARQRLEIILKAFGLANPEEKGNFEITEDEKRELAAAKRAATVARTGGSLAAAAASIRDAKDALRDAKPGTVDYFNALAELYNAQREYRDAILAYRDNVFRLGIDLTDPVATAAADLRAARAKLASDRAAGQGKDVLAADELAVKNAQTQLEATKFSQRLQNAQTALQLGRMSHAAYIRYLDSEHDRLTAIKKRTQQQQNQLNEVDLAMKAAREQMSGQFNLGDIKIPTPYEVRRYVKTVGGSYAPAGGDTTQVNVYVDGELYAQRVIDRQMGAGKFTTVGTSGSKY